MKKIEAIEIAARNIGDLAAKDVPTVCTATTIDATSLVHPQAGQLAGYRVFIYGGAGATQSRVITDFTSATNRITVEQAFSPVPSTNSTFFIFQKFDSEDYEAAFSEAYHRLFFSRGQLIDTWGQKATQFDRLQVLWLAERAGEQSAWSAVKKQEQVEWAAAQTGWKTALDTLWLASHRQVSGLVYTLPTLSMVTPGSLPIGTLPVGTLPVPSLPLAAIPSISTMSYGQTVSDEVILIDGIAEHLAARKVTEAVEWQQKFGIFKQRTDEAMAREQAMLDYVTLSYQDIWDKHKQQFDQSWGVHKTSYAQQWESHKASWESYKASIELRWTQMAAIFAVKPS